MKARASLMILAVILVISLLASCGGGDSESEDPTDEIKPAFDGEAYTVFGNDPALNFSVIYGSGDVSTFANLAVDVCDLVVEKGLPKPSFFADRDKTESPLELLIGDTNRALSAEAKAIVEENAAKDPNGKHWVWLYKNGQLAFYANSAAAYSALIDDLADKFFRDGVFKSKDNLKEIGHVEGPHEAYMSYEIPDNYYEAYTDPFSLNKDEYKTMTLTLVNDATYRISYEDELGGRFSQDFVKKDFGMYMMGLISYTDRSGKVHNITTSATDHEFVLRIGAKTTVTTRSGAHGSYPGDKKWEYFVDDTSYHNDRMLDMTFYDGRTGAKVELSRTGESAVLDGVRIVIHHNVYEMNYVQENVLVNSVREYLYSGYDIRFDARLYMTQDVKMANSMSAMLPISKQYGNCAMFYKPDGSTVYMKTPLSNTQDETVMGVEAYVIDLWGENNPQYHMTLRLNTPEYQLMNSAVGTTEKGFTGFREMLAGKSNKIYCSFMSSGTQSLAWGEELHFNTTWSFSIQEDFKNPEREPDCWVGVIK